VSEANDPSTVSIGSAGRRLFSRKARASAKDRRKDGQPVRCASWQAFAGLFRLKNLNFRGKMLAHEEPRQRNKVHAKWLFS